MSGTYEIEIPHDSTVSKIGDTFEVKYHCSVEEGVMFIGRLNIEDEKSSLFTVKGIAIPE